MNALFETLALAVQKSLCISLSASFLWGVLSIVLSPCHLSSIPLIIGYISKTDSPSNKTAFQYSLIFSLGILITIGLIGVITSLSGRMLGDIGVIGNIIVALLFIVIGLYLMDILTLHFSFFNLKSGEKKRGFRGAFFLGLVFGIGVGPCTFAYMAPILAIIYSASVNSLVSGLFMLLFYAAGHCSVIILAGIFSGIVQKYLKWSEKSQSISILKKICGGLVILAGIYLVVKQLHC